MAAADIQDARQLEGKQIGVNDARSAESLILRKMLRAYGLKDGAYELVSAGPPMERCEKLRAGAIAATMVTEPFHFLLENEGFIFIGSSVEAAPGYPFTVAVVRKTVDVDERFVKFLRVLLKSWDWLADAAHRGRAVEILSAVIGTEPELAEKTYELYLNPPSPPSLEPTEHGVAAVFELLADSKRLPMPLPPARRYIDRRYFETLEAA
jgi:ABC-type nitrate/sulfonate/bicarbonate transport system substrate-binding protein